MISCVLVSSPKADLCPSASTTSLLSPPHSLTLEPTENQTHVYRLCLTMNTCYLVDT